MDELKPVIGVGVYSEEGIIKELRRRYRELKVQIDVAKAKDDKEEYERLDVEWQGVRDALIERLNTRSSKEPIKNKEQ